MRSTSTTGVRASEKAEGLASLVAVSRVPFREADGVGDAIEVDGLWIGLRRPLDQWPAELRRQWEFDLGWIFADLGNRRELPPTQQKVCLCLDVPACRFKTPGERENRGCSRYGNGLCSEASWNAAEGKPIPQAVLAFFYGMSFKQLRSLQEECIRGWINDILADPVLREYIEHLGLGDP